MKSYDLQSHLNVLQYRCQTISYKVDATMTTSLIVIGMRTTVLYDVSTFARNMYSLMIVSSPENCRKRRRSLPLLLIPCYTTSLCVKSGVSLVGRIFPCDILAPEEILCLS